MRPMRANLCKNADDMARLKAANIRARRIER
jgi:hypothetical protein